jgi:hypothetical protein
MAKRQINNQAQIEAWTLDQLTKSAFFHRKLHEWKLLEVATAIEQVRGETLTWDNLQISEQAWNKIIHRGIKPVIVFAHPVVLQSISGSTGYYRMLAMVSQKSMKRVGLSLDSYEVGKTVPGDEDAVLIARHLNRLVSNLIELDEEINAREFDLWRGMAAGSQAQGSWQNNKGSIAEIAVEEVIRRRLQEKGFVKGIEADHSKVDLGAGRFLVFADDPDIAIYESDAPQIAVEVKGGIDPAAVLERIGAAIKSLQRIRQENPASVTILILQDVSLTERAKTDLSISTSSVSHLFSTESILEDEIERERFFQILKI